MVVVELPKLDCFRSVAVCPELIDDSQEPLEPLYLCRV